MTIKDDELSAFLDRALSPAAMDTLARRIEAEPGLRHRLDALRAADRMAAARLATVLEEPLPLPLVQAVMHAGASAADKLARPSLWRRLRDLVLGAGFGALAGVAATVAAVILTAPPPRSWTDEVASYHRIYARETAHLVEVGAERAEHIREWLGARIGRDLPIPDLTAFGLTFRGARLLAAADAPVAQLVYTDASGGVFALCLTPRPGAPDAAPTQLPLGDLDAVLWREGGTAMPIIGPADTMPLAPLADAVAAML